MVSGWRRMGCRGKTVHNRGLFAQSVASRRKLLRHDFPSTVRSRETVNIQTLRRPVKGAAALDLGFVAVLAQNGANPDFASILAGFLVLQAI